MLSNLQMSFILAIALGQRGAYRPNKTFNVLGSTVAKLLGYDRLTTYHTRLLKELCEAGWIERDKYLGAWRYSLQATAWKNIEAATSIEHGYVPVFDDVPF